tara:strand:- start:149 stop:574 length:426 start_codon:yes stop_codon:yes gene_type:complete
MKSLLVLSALLLSASPAFAQSALEWNPVSLIKTDQRLAQSHSSKLVFVLLYNPNADDEGIHTLENGNSIQVLLFQKEEDALVYSSRLGEMNFPVPTVTELYEHDVLQFISDNNYTGLIVGPGAGDDAPIGETSNLPKDHNY